MFQAILCDDNEIILEGLSRQIGWEELGIHLTGTAADGLEAWTQIKEHPPDILITDIRMPYIDGLELSRLAKELNPNIVILIISAYDDFEYARTAMHLRALDYILKPIEPDSMNRVLKNAVSHCRQFHHDKRMMMTQLLLNAAVLEGPASKDDDYWRELDFDPEAFCCFLQIELEEQSLDKLSDDIRYTLERRFSALYQLLEKDSFYLLESHQYSYSLCIIESSQMELIMQRKILVDSIRRQFPYEGSFCDVSIASGDVIQGVRNLHQSVKTCREACKLHFIKGSNADIFYEEIKSYIFNESTNNHEYPIPDSRLIVFIKEQNMDGIEKELDHLKNWLYQKGSESYLYLTFSLGSFYTHLIKELGESGINLQDIFQNPIEEFKKIAAGGTLESSIDNLKQNLFKISSSIGCNKSRYGRLIDTALTYIQNHYMHSTFSIDEVANVVCLSTSYFSTVFKNETGITFTDYLIKIRMEKAKGLLENTNMKMYEISSLVGYENAAYFSAAFKKYYGKSPSEYQNRR
uniref:response regulator transcription factor n=1 Tax=Enterocloster hominis (ex Hitch et al. 2024) TaxID=1917870 RepID=UPI00103218D2|nr:helix-turn-helix domain-containing protein [Lachnoclostridium pacaense]